MTLSILERYVARPEIFSGKKVVVVGDIAFDRSWRCRTPAAGLHATHGQEITFDVEPGGDDQGTVGASQNNCLFCEALGATTSLWTVVGDDEEGRRVVDLLRSRVSPFRAPVLAGIDTVTRLRFFVRDDAAGCYRLVFRVDREPDSERSFRQAEDLFRSESLLADFEKDLADADALLFNDTEKGFLSAAVVEGMSRVVRKIQQGRDHSGRRPLLVLVDPKFDWSKFRCLPVTILKPNSREALRAAGLGSETLDFGQDANLEALGARLQRAWGSHFPRIVVTLGRHGAALLESDPVSAQLYHFPGVPPNSSGWDVATHCGDAFGAALTLGISLDPGDLLSALTFANAVASLQYSRPAGSKVTRADILEPAVSAWLKSRSRPPSLIARYSA